MRRSFGLAVLCWLAASPGFSQEVSLWLGGSHARYGDSISGTAGLVAARAHRVAGRGAGTVEGSFSQFVTGEWVAQLNAQGIALAPTGRHINIGAVGGASAIALGGSWGGGAAAGPTLAAATGSWLGTLGATVGGVRRADGSTLAVGTAAARLRYSPLWRPALEGAFATTVADGIRYLDASVSISVRDERFVLEALGGLRAGDLSDGPWGYLRGEYGFGAVTTIEAQIGRYAQDLLGFTGGVFGSLGVRVALFRATRTGPLRFDPSAVRVERLDAGRVRVAVRYHRDAARLAIVGEWNDWTPQPLANTGRGRWSAVLPLGPGTYRYALLVDGERWTVPEGVLTLPDDFGGEVALLIVPAP